MIGIIFIGDLKYCPYLTKFVDVLEDNNIEYEVLFWNREGTDLKYPQNYISYNVKSKLNRNPIFKIADFISFRSWLKKEIALRNFKKLIVLSTLSGVIISDVLLNEYPQKYIFDIRDYSYEHYRFFFKKEEMLIKNSYFTGISSKGFKEFLPRGYEYNIVHNFNKADLKNRRNFIKKHYGSTLNLIWIGAVRYFEHQRKIIDKLRNDNRYKLIYHGTGPELEEFKRYCEHEQITNTIFTGAYSNYEKQNLLHDADILNNNYKSNKIMEVKYAISNKYYDGLIFGIPQLVETDTFKNDIVKENGVGIGLDPNDIEFANKLYEYYFSIDEKTFNSVCEREIQKISSEDEKYINYINEFINYK